MNKVNQITPEQAFNNITIIVRSYRGTAEEHEVISESLRIIKELIVGQIESIDPNLKQTAKK